MQIDSSDLAAFQAGMRRRYSDDEILSELKECAERLGRSPTMREFEGDRSVHVHPQTVIERFGIDRKAKYRGLSALEKAGLVRVRRKLRRNPVVTILDWPEQSPGTFGHHRLNGDLCTQPIT